MINKNELISLKTARLAYKKGFTGECHWYWDWQDILTESLFMSSQDNMFGRGGNVSAPTRTRL